MMKISIFTTISAIFLSGCNYPQTVVVNQPAQEIRPRYVEMYTPVCYQQSVPIYGSYQIISEPNSNDVVLGSVIGAALGHSAANDNNKVLGAVAGALIGGSIANTPRVETQRYVIGYEYRTICN